MELYPQKYGLVNIRLRRRRKETKLLLLGRAGGLLLAGPFRSKLGFL
jgi:hypothetical protein